MSERVRKLKPSQVFTGKVAADLRRSARQGPVPAKIGESMAPRTRSTPKKPSRSASLRSLLEQAQLEQDLSQEAAARISGVTVSAYRKILASNTRPQQRTLWRLARGLKIPLNSLLVAAGYEPVTGGDEIPEAEAGGDVEERLSRVEQAVRELDKRQDRTDSSLGEMRSEIRQEFGEVRRLITALVPTPGASSGSRRSRS